MAKNYSWYGGPTSFNRHTEQADKLRNEKSFKFAKYNNDSQKLGKLYDEVWAKVEGVEGLEGLREEKARTMKMIAKNRYLRENAEGMVYARIYLHKIEDQEARLEGQIASSKRSQLEATVSKPNNEASTHYTEERPGVKYPHVRSPITADKVPYSPRPQIPFGSIPAHIQERRINTASQLASMYAENSLPSTSLSARLARKIRRNPIKSAIAAGIIGLAGLGAWVTHEYNLYKQPVITQSTVTPTRATPIVADSSTTREYISQNVDMELPAGFNLASMTSSKGSSQAKLPEKQVARADQVKSVKSVTNQKSLEHQLSEWFSQASEKATIFANRLDKATKRIAQEYELMREEPQRHFNMEKTLAYILSVDTAAPQLSDESFTVRVGPAEDEAEMPARVKRGIPSNYWPVESPLKSGIGAPLVVYYNAGNSKHISPETQTVESSPNPKPLSNEWFEKIKAKHKLAGKN